MLMSPSVGFMGCSEALSLFTAGLGRLFSSRQRRVPDVPIEVALVVGADVVQGQGHSLAPCCLAGGHGLCLCVVGADPSRRWCRQWLTLPASWLSPAPLLSAETRDPGACDAPDALEHG